MKQTVFTDWNELTGKKMIVLDQNQENPLRNQNLPNPQNQFLFRS